MASTATRKRPAGKAGRSKAAPRRAGKEVRRAASKAARRPAAKARRAVVRAVARRTGKVVLNAGREVVSRAAAVGAELSNGGVRRLSNGSVRRPPIQRSIDVAVPISVAWREWMQLECLPEGVDEVLDIERDGSELVSDGWVGEIRDERPEESFAWLSVEGSDCAGLVTFHQLGERLTRIELDLDVQPVSPKQAVMLITHLADRRAEAELRRFKSRVEFLSPDEYEDQDQGRQ